MKQVNDPVLSLSLPRGWQALPCLDSDDRALSLQRLLDIRRYDARSLGTSAVEAIKQGGYRTPSGHWVDWREDVERAKAGKRSIRPDDPLPARPDSVAGDMTVQVCNETTLQAALRLTGQGLRPVVLNLANGMSPGGGFLHGARAQEESLCRASALYATLEGDPMYAFHRARPEPDSSDWAILSPGVPVFRDDAGKAREHPWRMDVLTSAAPYAPTVGQPRSGDLLRGRIHRVLAVAAAHGYRTLVLGAWGCGAFGNDPHRTARDFRAALERDFRGCFEHVVFAITDWSPERRFLGPFRDVFASEDGFRLKRFVTVQMPVYEAALSELVAGCKRSHWMWFVLPQLRGLGTSAMAQEYSLVSLDEARAYLAHPVLGPRLRDCVAAIQRHRGTAIDAILGEVDALKYRSCLTLFSLAGPSESLFDEALQTFYGGEHCQRTLTLLAWPSGNRPGSNASAI